MDNIIKVEDFDLDNILIDEKSYKNILVYGISYKSLFGSKPLRIKFDEANGFIRVYRGIRYLLLFGPENMMLFTVELYILLAGKAALHMIFLIIMQKLELILMILCLYKKYLQNVVTLIKSLLNKDKNHYYYNIFLEKVLHKHDI